MTEQSRPTAPPQNVMTGSAIASPAAHLRFWLPAAALVLLDLWSKEWVFANLHADEARPWIPGLIEFRRSLNDGAVFGSFTGYVGAFILASVLALLFVLYMFASSARNQRILHVSLALILAGAIGNLYDRAFIRADVVRFPNQPDHHSIVGKIVSEPGADHVVIGEWPEGSRERKYARAEVDVRQQGVVRDFIKFTPQFPRHWAWVGGQDMWPWIFNIADASLVCGVALLLATSILERRPHPAPVGRSESVAAS